MGWMEIIKELFGSNSWQYLAVFCVLGFFALYKSLLQMIWNIQDRRLSQLKNALEVDSLSNEVKFVLVENLNRSLFMQVTGIAGDQYIRNVYQQLLENSEGDLTINQLKRASPFLEFKDKKIKAESGKGREIGYLFDKWYPLLLVFASIGQLMNIIFLGSSDTSLFVQWGLVFLCLSIAVYLYRRSLSYEIALMVEELQHKKPAIVDQSEVEDLSVLDIAS